MKLSIMKVNEVFKQARMTEHTSTLDDCLEDLRIIACNPIDKKLLKAELHDKYSEYTIKLARKIMRGR